MTSYNAAAPTSYRQDVIVAGGGSHIKGNTMIQKSCNKCKRFSETVTAKQPCPYCLHENKWYDTAAPFFAFSAVVAILGGIALFVTYY